MGEIGNLSRSDSNFQSSCKVILESFSQAKREEFTAHGIAIHIRSTIPPILLKEAKLDQSMYRVQGSPGQGNWADVPWVAVFNKQKNVEATKGYYIVFVFRSDFKGFYISLNQGCTYFHEKYKEKLGNEKLGIVSNKVRELLHTIPKEQGLINIDLVSQGRLAKGYMKGHICGTYYDQDNLPDSKKIIEDLEELLITYEELLVIMNGRTLEQFNDYLLLNDDQYYLEDESSEEKFQETLLEIEKKNQNVPNYIEENPELRPPALVDKGGSEKWPRDSKKASRALRNNNFKCSFDDSHSTFISKKSGKFYVEAHHFIPMAQQKSYKYNLDRVANIFALCPNCHRMVHHGRDNDKVIVLRKLYKDRIHKLESLGLGITFTDLCKAYGISKGGNDLL